MSHLSPPVGPLDHIQGDAEAPVTLVEYGDFECPYCGAEYGVIKAVQAAMGAQLRFVFRHFPLTDMHAHALHAAEFAEAAASIGKFWEAHDVLYEHQASLGDRALAQYAAQLGVPAHALSNAFDGAFDARIQQDFDGGLRSGVNGTPTLFINGHRYDGERDAASLLEALRAVLDRVQ
ncbi:DsbA family protein [Caballeronia sp. LP006]|jgi:protein-disulfide isomerase|uniref:DsbA family protein n=1 Tax=unclassified Caballeronia TaxID=2646786 RepID=UPI001FD26A35|nr:MULTISPECIES: DsbA family protein [unclassified Caballeronia]MDR5774284.1 DsbA family protein [Caballeronia sp. LZ002]MDR5805817.1 DsbA family protein [Caballeronia sp. LZ001]MDR5827061.1 DsbA family protein [Caballeronia sp. LP006]MDR5849719.1 DsbA family protein [Caballeronia sp. LZ003]